MSCLGERRVTITLGPPLDHDSAETWQWKHRFRQVGRLAMLERVARLGGALRRDFVERFSGPAHPFTRGEASGI